MEEIWKDIEGYEGLYKISNLGRVKSLRNFSGVHKKYYKYEKIMKPVDNGRGYLTAMLSKNKIKKHKYIHRLVTQEFIANPYNLPEVNHKDENKKNNCVNNLEWCERIYNNQYGTKNKRGAEKRGIKVLQIDINTNKIINIFPSIRQAARTNKLLFSSIRACCVGKARQAYGYKWRYADDEIYNKQ